MDELRNLHKLLYNPLSTVFSLKKNHLGGFDLDRSRVNSELVKRILNFLMHPKPSGKPLMKSLKTYDKDNQKETE
ncbi:hypothetical protein MC885_002623 [Smutsia gigantea]|nr:hypothetical protein MC885_002623 [Smutsia gigantea]